MKSNPLSQEEKKIRKAEADARYRKKNKEKISAQDKHYKQKHADKLKAQSIQYSIDNREKIRLFRAQHHEKNKHDMDYRDKVSKNSANWRKNNPDKVSVTGSTRYYKLEQATPDWSEADEIKIIYQKRDELREIYKIPFEVDHIIPINSNTVCGLHVLSNL